MKIHIIWWHSTIDLWNIAIIRSSRCYFWQLKIIHLFLRINLAIVLLLCRHTALDIILLHRLPLIRTFTRSLLHSSIWRLSIILFILFLQAYKFLLIYIVLRILTIVNVVFSIKIFINLLFTVDVEDLILQTFHIHGRWAKSSLSCSLRELMG